MAELVTIIDFSPMKLRSQHIAGADRVVIPFRQICEMNVVSLLKMVPVNCWMGKYAIHPRNSGIMTK